MKVVMVVIALAVIVGVFVFPASDRVVRLNERVEAAWAGVEDQLQLRHDLMANLVITVRDVASREKKLLEEAVAARDGWKAAQGRDRKIDEAREMNGILARLCFVADGYPWLKTDERYLTLREQLEDNDNRLAVAQRRYNQAVEEFNAFLRTVPGRICGVLRGIGVEKNYFKLLPLSTDDE